MNLYEVTVTDETLAYTDRLYIIADNLAVLNKKFTDNRMGTEQILSVKTLCKASNIIN
jgi:hypothetical protein